MRSAEASARKILFLTGTRADFGKLKPLMCAVEASPLYDCRLFVTGMHNLKLYGYTVEEVQKNGFRHVHCFINQFVGEPMEMVLANTIAGLSRYVHEEKPDMIVVHGDRVEALAGAIVGAMQNILVGHIEGGERSGTVDELIRHSVSKLSHLHFVANQEAATRLLQMGEQRDHIYTIGSPDIDVMNSTNLPTIQAVKDHYEIPFENYGIALFHPVTTESKEMRANAENFVEALIQSKRNYVVVYPNNDEGTAHILEAYKRLEGLPNFAIFPSIRFESFLTLIKYSDFMIGNSSAGVREAPYYGLPSIDIGTRQRNRYMAESIIHCDYPTASILAAINSIPAERTHVRDSYFGTGNSTEQFMQALAQPDFWKISPQKQFHDLPMQNMFATKKASNA
jgi:UDP-N-acetylglucosamine 2-epimerase (hydrolysing)